MQDLWQVHYQILLIISYKESIKLNIKILIVFLNMRKFDMRKVEKTNMRKFKAQFDKT